MLTAMLRLSLPVLLLLPSVALSQKGGRPPIPSRGDESETSMMQVSRSGVFGDATLATRAKGKRLVEALVAGILADLEAMRP
jgi:creatinine amidohydrolase/Fe(II)-dependent formamide hydrolase-like protein